MSSRHWAFSWVLTSIAAVPLAAQSVISVRSGMIHFSEGAVFLDDQALEHRFGKFDQMKNGAELRTENGRAEILLTPAAFLRIGEDSAIRMISNRLADTQVAFLRGSAVLDSTAATSIEHITLVSGNYQVLIRAHGRYRLSSEPPALTVEQGEAEVLGSSDAELAVAGQRVPFSAPLRIEQFENETADALGSWNKTRNDSISRESLAAGAGDLSTVLDGWDKDPAALLRALEASYAPFLSNRTPGSAYTPLSTYSPAPSYTAPSIYSPLSTYTPYSTYSPLLGVPGPGVTPFGVWGLGFGSPLFLYTPSYLRTYSPLTPSYRSPLVTGRPGVGGSPIYQPGMRPPGLSTSPIHTGVGHFGGRR